MVMIYMGGHVSGAHYNPAVSLAVLLRGKTDVKDFGIYIACQLAAGLVAALAVYAITGKSFAPAPGKDATTLGALLVEFFYTFALVLVVLNVATSKATQGNSYYGLAIGFTIAAGAFAGGGVSGGAYNPAVGIAPNLIHAALGDGALGHVWLYIAGPLAGAALAALVFKIQEGEEETSPAA
jgi:aquaporin Z